MEIKDIEKRASYLLGKDVSLATPHQGGRNNRLFRIVQGGKNYALKFYPTQIEDPRNRLQQEYDALSFMYHHGVTSVPQPLACDASHHCALYTWAEGEKVSSCADAILSMCEFIRQLSSLRQHEEAQKLAVASDACLMPYDVERQLYRRLSRLDQAISSTSGSEDLAHFLETRFKVAIQKTVSASRHMLKQHGMAWDQPLEPKQRILSPSDFGMHNMLMQNNGTFLFLDFEYFGWDDPVKMVSDVAWHPGSSFSVGLVKLWVDKMSQQFSGANDPQFRIRLRALYPVFGLIWCLILLNEYLPERRLRREQAGAESGRLYRQQQLFRVRTRLDDMETHAYDHLFQN